MADLFSTPPGRWGGRVCLPASGEPFHRVRPSLLPKEQVERGQKESTSQAEPGLEDATHPLPPGAASSPLAPSPSSLVGPSAPWPLGGRARVLLSPVLPGKPLQTKGFLPNEPHRLNQVMQAFRFSGGETLDGHRNRETTDGKRVAGCSHVCLLASKNSFSWTAESV